MTTKDYNHLNHECDNILKAFQRHRNPVDCAVAEEVVNRIKELLENYHNYCQWTVNNHNGGTPNA